MIEENDNTNKKIKTYLFNNDITENNINELILALQDIEDNPIDLYFGTYGGELIAMNYLLHFLNLRSEQITLYLTGQICSAGTKLLTDFKGKIVFTDDLRFIMFHKWDFEKYTLRKPLGGLDIKFITSMTDLENKYYASKLKKLGLTKQEIKTFNKGQDVWLYQTDYYRLNVNNA